MIGGNYDDEIIGNDHNNALIGLDGDDAVTGGAGDDTLLGDGPVDLPEIPARWRMQVRGEDVLDGGDGRDTLRGGPARDICSNGERISGCERRDGRRGPRRGSLADSSALARLFGAPRVWWARFALAPHHSFSWRP